MKETEVILTESEIKLRESFITPTLRPNLELYVKPDDLKNNDHEEDTDNRNS